MYVESHAYAPSTWNLEKEDQDPSTAAWGTRDPV